MATVSILHYTHSKNSDGTSPIIIQVIENRKPKKRTLVNIFSHQWDNDKKRVIPRSHPNYATINIRISDEYNRIEKLILENKFDLKRDFIDYFDSPQSTVTVNQSPNFKELVKLYISTLKSGFSMMGYETRLNYFIKHAHIGDLRLNEITRAHMNRFMKHMKDKGNKRSTMRTNLSIIRYVSSFAARTGIDVKNPLLHDDALPIAERSVKRKLDKAELTSLKELVIENDPIAAEMRDMFLLAVYLRGMRIGDVIQLRQEYFSDGRLIYESNKNKKTFNIKLIPDAVEIVNKYLDGRQYLFTFFKLKPDEAASNEVNMKAMAQHVKSITAFINGKLKGIAGDAGITKNLSTHIARHTFAKMAIDTVQDINLSMDLVGHSNIKEHQLYIREISEAEDLDNAADRIFG